MARLELQKHSNEIDECVTFDDLLHWVEKHTAEINRFGRLAVYDTALRLGAHLDKWPTAVYVHAGPLKACRLLNVSTKGGKVETGRFDNPIQELTPFEIEHFLCTFKGRLSNTSNAQKTLAD